MIIWRNQGNNLTGVTVTENGGTVTATGGNISVARTSGGSLLGFRKTDQVAGASGQKWYGYLTVTGVAFTDCMVGLIDADSIDYLQMVGLYITGLGNFGAWEESGYTADNSTQGGALDTEYELSFEILGSGAVRIRRGSTIVGNTVVGTSGNYTAKNLRFMCSVIGSTASTFNFDEVLATDDGTFTPPAPTTPAASATGQTTATGTWSDATCTTTNADGISVEISTTSGSGFSVDGTANIGDETYDFTGLTASTTYYVRYRAYVSVNGVTTYGAYTSEASFTTNSPASSAPSGGSSNMRQRARHLKLFKVNKRKD